MFGRRSTESSLQELEEAYAGAQARLSEAQEQSAQAAEWESQLAGLEADFVLGQLDAEERDRCSAELRDRIATVRARVTETERVVAELGRRAAARAQAEADASVAEAESQLAAVDDREEEARSILADVARQQAEAREQLRVARDAALRARAPYVPSVAKAAADADRREREQVEYLAKLGPNFEANLRSSSVELGTGKPAVEMVIEEHLRPKILEARLRRHRNAAAERHRQAEQARRSRIDAFGHDPMESSDPHAVGEGQQFPRAR